MKIDLNENATMAIFAIAVAAVLVAFMCSCATAESAIVSFDDAEHLAALTDSVVGVCDTTWQLPDSVHIWWGTTDSQQVAFNKIHNLPIITCRRLVGVTKMYPPMYSLWVPEYVGWSVDSDELKIQETVMRILGIPGEPPRHADVIPGTAIIFYEEGD